jgi:hypothetical protein
VTTEAVPRRRITSLGVPFRLLGVLVSGAIAAFESADASRRLPRRTAPAVLAAGVAERASRRLPAPDGPAGARSRWTTFAEVARRAAGGVR